MFFFFFCTSLRIFRNGLREKTTCSLYNTTTPRATATARRQNTAAVAADCDDDVFIYTTSDYSLVIIRVRVSYILYGFHSKSYTHARARDNIRSRGVWDETRASVTRFSGTFFARRHADKRVSHRAKKPRAHAVKARPGTILFHINVLVV